MINPRYRKTKGAYRMQILCGYCKSDILEYEKLGRGGVIRLYLERIVSGQIDFEKLEKTLKCPNCREIIGIKSIDKKNNKIIYNVIKSTFNTKKLF